MDEANRPLVKLMGDYDLTRREELYATLQAYNDQATVAIDLENVRYMDSTSLRVLINLNKHFVLQGGPPLQLLNLQPRLQRLIQITGLEKVFDIQ